MRALLDVVAPIHCVGCGASAGVELCARCADDVCVITDPVCGRCGAPVPAPSQTCAACRGLAGFARARSLVAYASPVRELTLALKRRGRRPVVNSIGVLLADLALARGLRADAVTFVPGGARARERGFDHAELLARAAARRLNLPLARLVVRAREGPRQADVPLGERRSNVRGRFIARPAPGRVLVVDDVFTTGATVEACALALRASGARTVDAVTWARTLRRGTIRA